MYRASQALPVPVVWSLGGSVVLVAFTLFHLLGPTLTSLHWHRPFSKSHGPWCQK